MNTLESRIKGLEEHIEKLYKTIEGWEKVAKEKDEIIKKYERQVKNNVGLANVVKSLPNDDMVKAHIDTLPYYGTCTTEYNEGFEDGVKWLKEQLAK